MGVKLSELVPRKQIEFSDLTNKTIAVDASNMIYQFLSSIRQQDGTPLSNSKGHVTSHLVGIFSRLSNLISKNIKLAIVFDGKPPALKFKEKERREQRKKLAEEKLKKAKEKEDIEAMQRYSKQTVRFTKEMAEEAKELIKAMGLPVIQSPSEADAQAAFMCEQKDVWATASSDFDSLVFGSPRMITNLTLSQKRRLPSGATVSTKPDLIILKDVLENLNLKQDQLIALAILVGTDYNPGGIKGIGPKTALKLVKEYNNYDELFKKVKADFNWKKIYAIYKSMPIMKNYQLKWSEVNSEKVKKILVDKYDFSEERVTKTLKSINKENLSKWF